MLSSPLGLQRGGGRWYRPVESHSGARDGCSPVSLGWWTKMGGGSLLLCAELKLFSSAQTELYFRDLRFQTWDSGWKVGGRLGLTN